MREDLEASTITVSVAPGHRVVSMPLICVGSVSTCRHGQLADDILKTNQRSVATYKKLYREAQNTFLKDGIQYEIQRLYKQKSAP